MAGRLKWCMYSGLVIIECAWAPSFWLCSSGGLAFEQLAWTAFVTRCSSYGMVCFTLLCVAEVVGGLQWMSKREVVD